MLRDSVEHLGGSSSCKHSACISQSASTDDLFIVCRDILEGNRLNHKTGSFIFSLGKIKMKKQGQSEQFPSTRVGNHLWDVILADIVKPLQANL